uniref:Uncharacterized protein n=1 Tax=Parascaris univalens TaxID=6257 RepID=A0A914ZDZ2_PARUN
MRYAHVIFFLFLAKGVDAIQIGDNVTFDVEIIKHQPCPFNPATSKWKRILEFEEGNDRIGPKLVQTPGEKNCYSIGGKVNVYSEFKGDFSIYIELRNTANKKQVPESCVNQRPDGCGGFGSCLYCNACEVFGSSIGVKAKLLIDGKSIKCGDSLPAGVYDNIKLLFCLPPAEDILKTQGLTRDSFLSLVRSENEPLPPDVYWSLPFNMMIKKQRVFVACHKIYGNVRFSG